MWSGNAKNIPNGWVLCDGKNNSPDLRNRFIIGATATYPVNKIGGSTTHKHHIDVHGHQLTINELPSHRHQISDKIWMDDNRNNTHFTGNDWVGHKKMKKISLGARLTTAVGGNNAHQHTASSRYKEHLPPYYALCFIMKIV